MSKGSPQFGDQGCVAVAIVYFVTGALLVVVIIGVAVYGWVTLPPDARTPGCPFIADWGAVDRFLVTPSASALPVHSRVPCSQPVRVHPTCLPLVLGHGAAAADRGV